MKNKVHDDMHDFKMEDRFYQGSYVELASERIIFLNEDFTKATSSDMSALLLHYDSQSHDEITIYINSNGGDAAALTNIYDVMQMVQSPINTICIGKAYSAGAVLLAIGTKGNRFIYKNASVMIHGIQTLFPVIGHDIVNSKLQYKALESKNDTIMNMLAEHTCKTLDQIKSDCSRDYWMDAKKAVEYGIVDYIL